MDTRIASRQNPRLRELSLIASDASVRRDCGIFLAEGIHLAEEAFAVIPQRIRTLAVTDEALALPAVASIRARAEALPDVEILVMPRPCYEKLSALRSPEGIAVVCAIETPEPSVFFNPTQRIVALAGVQDPGNAGAVVRTAAAAGMDGVVFLDQSVDPTHPALIRAAMGSTFRIPTASLTESDLVTRARACGMRLAGAVVRADTPYDRADWSAPVCVVIGSEGGGIPPSLIKQLDVRVAIPMAHGVESLNAAVAAGIILYAARQR